MTRTAYLDHASTSPLRPCAAGEMAAWLIDPGGDPGRIHHAGMRSRVAVEDARDRVAQLFGARPREVIFTSGATEAIAQVGWGCRTRGPHSVAAAVEHSAVRMWAERGPHTVVGVDGFGRVDPDRLMDAVRSETGVVHLQWGNHEVGTTQPVAEVVGRCRERGVLVHLDAAQAAGRVSIDFVGLGCDLLSISGHKLGGPPGTGVLLVRRGLRLDPLLVGGDQELARRGGMENVAGIVGLGAAATELAGSLDTEADLQRRLTTRIVDWAQGPHGAALGLGVLGDPVDRLPHIVCLRFEGLEPQPVLLGLEQAGCAVHSGSSCTSGTLEPSPVLEAMGVDADRSLRISVGWSSTERDVDHLLGALPPVIDGLRALRT